MTEYAAEAPLATSEFSNLNTIYSDPLFSYGTAHFDNYDLYNYVYPVYGITSNLLYNTKEYSENTKYTREQVAKFYKKSTRSEEHTSELQSRPHLVCRLLLEK